MHLLNPNKNLTENLNDLVEKRNEIVRQDIDEIVRQDIIVSKYLEESCNKIIYFIYLLHRLSILPFNETCSTHAKVMHIIKRMI
jgi:hypothetical protein